jgi:hypothetical protein
MWAFMPTWMCDLQECSVQCGARIVFVLVSLVRRGCKHYAKWNTPGPRFSFHAFLNTDV